jgi:hypothetical protein
VETKSQIERSGSAAPVGRWLRPVVSPPKNLRMKTKPTYTNNILTSELLKLPEGTLFSEHVFDGLAPEPTLFKKIANTLDDKDIIIEPISLGQYAEVPGERCCLGYDDTSEKEWRVWSKTNVEKMIGWLMTTHQSLKD